jgi:hypothetical protein
MRWPKTHSLAINMTKQALHRMVLRKVERKWTRPVAHFVNPIFSGTYALSHEVWLWMAIPAEPLLHFPIPVAPLCYGGNLWR